MENENIISGYGMDPGTVYGPGYVELISPNPGSEEKVVREAPLDGAKPSGEETVSMSRIGLRTFFRSPVGLLVILVPAAYLAFCQVYGRG